jgi:hypothetical protein
MSNHWNDEEIEKLLQDLPPIKDTRLKNEVFMKLHQDERLQTPSPQLQRKQPKKSTNWVQWGSLIAGFVLVLVIPLIVALSNKENMAKNESSDQEFEVAAIQNGSEEMENHQFFDTSESKSMESSIVASNNRVADRRTSLYASQIGEGDITMTIGLASEDAEIVPISFVVPASYLEENELADASYLQLYKHVVSELDESQLGFTEFHPIEGSIEIVDGTLTNTLPDTHMYDQGTATIGMYFAAMSHTFGSVYDELVVKSESGKEIVFSHVGEMNEPYDLTQYGTQKVYYVYEQTNGALYLSNHFGQAATTFDEAVKLMKESPSDYYKSPLIEGAPFTLQQNAGYTSIIFDAPFTIEAYDEIQVMHMLEALIATAASFDLEVKFENVSMENWNGFDFTAPIGDFIAVNKIAFPLQ